MKTKYLAIPTQGLTLHVHENGMEHGHEVIQLFPDGRVYVYGSVNDAWSFSFDIESSGELCDTNIEKLREGGPIKYIYAIGEQIYHIEGTISKALLPTEQVCLAGSNYVPVEEVFLPPSS